MHEHQHQQARNDRCMAFVLLRKQANAATSAHHQRMRVDVCCINAQHAASIRVQRSHLDQKFVVCCCAVLLCMCVCIACVWLQNDVRDDHDTACVGYQIVSSIPRSPFNDECRCDESGVGTRHMHTQTQVLDNMNI